MKTTRWIWLLTAVAVVAVLVMVRTRRAHEREAAAKVETPPLAVRVSPVSLGTIASTRHVLGTVTGADEAEIAARIMGSVMEVRAREGDAVHRGQVLILLDPREAEDAVAQARAGLAAAREGLAAASIALETQQDATARDSVLFAARALSREQWDRSRTARAAARARRQAARSQVEAASHRLAQARTRLSYAELKAPFDGVVSFRKVDPGDLAVPGKPLMGVIRQSRVRVRAALPSADWPHLAVGQPATLTLNGTSVEAEVSRVFPAMGPSHLAVVEIDLDSPPAGFVSGTTVGVDLSVESDRGLRVPVDALLESRRGSFVFATDGDTVRAVPVQVRVRGPELATVSGALRDGDRVVVARPSRLMLLATGMHVRPVEDLPPSRPGL